MQVPTLVQRAAAFASIAGLIVVLLALPVPGTAVWIRVLQDASHGPIFAAIAIALAVLLRGPQRATPSQQLGGFRLRRAELLAFAGAMAIGLAVEIAQSAIGRPASLFDLGSDAAGAAVGLALLGLYRCRRGKPGPRLPRGAGPWILAAAAAAGVVFLTWRPVEAARAYLQRARQLPVLASFHSSRDLYLVRTHGIAGEIDELPARWARRDGERALRLSYDAAHGPGVQLMEPWSDWRGYDVLAVDLTNAAATELRLVLRVLDVPHDWSADDRLNLPFAVPAFTRLTLRVSLEAVRTAPGRRPMDLSRIANLMIHAAPAGEGDLYVSAVWLE